MINLLAASKALQVFIPALILLVLAMLFAIALAYLGKKLAVSRDERIDQVRDCLSGANCGACGYAGLRRFCNRSCRRKWRNFPPATQPQKKRKKKSRKFWDSPTPAKRRKSSFAPRRSGRERQIRLRRIRRLQKYGTSCRRSQTVRLGLSGNGIMRGRVPASRRYRKTKRIFRSVIKQVHFLRQVHFGVSEKDNKKDPRKRDLLRCVQQSPER